ncbi:hypothetical protein [Rhizobium rhizogenes]|uniref:hypothetical protein n=1 Tax=Rhizobium rhizogenes TaxID=359 RepID=UPI00157342A8|nr:hypothetical protein [Rhizobium rhizogenes]NTF64951.1 hypothetical protein [Rhizobium rhizogenes]NTG96299.1 hypothetical protein [Rhizobium rhizogenes]
MDFGSKNLASAGGGTLAFTAFSIFAVHAEILVHARPRMPQLDQGYVYRFSLKHLVVYISAMDVNEQRLLLILSLVGAIIGIGFSSRIRVSASVNGRVKFPSWIDEIKDKLWFEELAFVLAMSTFTTLILLFGPTVCSILLEYGIIILPPATS